MSDTSHLTLKQISQELRRLETIITRYEARLLKAKTLRHTLTQELHIRTVSDE